MKNAHRQVDLKQLIRLCHEESHQERQEEVGYCFELFRRALANDDQVAWEAIQKQYHGLVLSWLRRAAGDLLASTEDDDLTQTIFAKFWVSLRHKEGLLSDSFPHIGALLKYLNRCALTTFLDFQTKRQRRAKLQKRLVQEVSVNVYADPIPKLVESLQQEEKLLAVRRWARSHITDELEMQLYTLLYSEGLKPRDIVARYPQQFPTTEDVRRVQARILARARRALASIELK
jgi:DNA-directed RNA polymerase specialized sigma24 family protein